jgi:hypothetical protein
VAQVAVCSQINTEHINALYGQNIESFNIEHGSAKSTAWDLEIFHSNDLIMVIQGIS